MTFKLFPNRHILSSVQTTFEQKQIDCNLLLYTCLIPLCNGHRMCLCKIDSIVYQPVSICVSDLFMLIFSLSFFSFTDFNEVVKPK